MTHLRIEQNNGITEQVSPSVIEKLYEIVHSGNLDSSSNLMGSINTTGTYLNYVDYLEELFTKNGVRLLIITANKLYISFEDPEVLRILSTTYGDGAGVTLSDLESVSNIGTLFRSNTIIETFNEFLYFTGITHYYINWSSDDWFSNCTSLREITIPKNILNMKSDRGCFYGCSSLETVVFPSECIMEDCPSFYGCSNLINITLPDSIIRIPGSAFVNCLSLTTFNTNNVTELSGSTFRNCTSLTSINLPNISVIGGECFSMCTELTTVNWDNQKITGIHYSAFYNTNLVVNDLNLPNLTVFGNSAFYNTKVKQVSNLGSITSIPSQAFYGCNQLTLIVLPNTVISIDALAFLNCSSLTTVDLSNVTSISNEVFRGCTSLTSVIINLNVTSIGSSAFRDCTALTSIDLSNITSIGGSAFNGCTSLTNVNLSNVTSLGSYAFYNCTSLGTNLILELNLLNQASGSSIDNAFFKTNYKGLILHIPLSIEGRHNYPAWEQMNSLEFLDLSDARFTFDTFAPYVGSLVPLKTIILGETFSKINHRSICESKPLIQYLILLSPNIVNFTETYWSERIFRSTWAPNLHIYVLNSTLVSEYLADSVWSNVENLSTHIHPLSDLPAGIWTTGLASLYLTAAQLATS